MGMRLLTKKFTQYTIAQFEKKYDKTVVDFIDIGNLSVNKMIILIQMGNSGCSEQEAAEKLDNYLSDENNGLIDAYMQILEELDKDIHLFKGTGQNISDMRKAMYEKMNIDGVHKVVEDIPVEDSETSDLKDNEQVKVDINGFASLD